MGCPGKEDLQIKFPVVMISKSGGDAIKKSMDAGKKGKRWVSHIVCFFPIAKK